MIIAVTTLDELCTAIPRLMPVACKMPTTITINLVKKLTSHNMYITK